MAININQKSENNQELLGLKEIRKKKKLTQLKIAFDLNISREALSCYENGKRNPDIKTLLTLSDYFNVSIDYIIRGHEFQKKMKKHPSQICRHTFLYFFKYLIK